LQGIEDRSITGQIELVIEQLAVMDGHRGFIVEAGVRQGWDRWLLGERGREAKAGFIGMSSFGASAPIDRLYKEFGITAEATATLAKSLL
jgi:transketolase